ncbi:MAG: hypothetical protein P8Y45_11825, partial [Exilibacterium sp.]
IAVVHYGFTLANTKAERLRLLQRWGIFSGESASLSIIKFSPICRRWHITGFTKETIGKEQNTGL